MDEYYIACVKEPDLTLRLIIPNHATYVHGL